VKLAGGERRPRDSVDPEQQGDRDQTSEDQRMSAPDQKADRSPFPVCEAADSRSRRMARAGNADKRHSRRGTALNASSP
jgi:hypothetical protein